MHLLPIIDNRERIHLFTVDAFIILLIRYTSEINKHKLD
jgi:hypothetical protein